MRIWPFKRSSKADYLQSLPLFNIVMYVPYISAPSADPDPLPEAMAEPQPDPEAKPILGKILKVGAGALAGGLLAAGR